MKGALWKLPARQGEHTNEIEQLEKLADIDTMPYGNDLKVIAYHPTDETKVVSVVDNNFVLWDLNGPSPQVLRTCDAISSFAPFFIFNPKRNKFISKLARFRRCSVRQRPAKVHQWQMESSQWLQSILHTQRHERQRMGLEESVRGNVDDRISAFANN